MRAQRNTVQEEFVNLHERMTHERGAVGQTVGAHNLNVGLSVYV